METTAKPLHLGRKISRLRELRGMKQEAPADALGMSQQTVSRIEASETVDNDTLEKIVGALGLSVEAIKNFNKETVFNIISNSFTSNDSSTLHAINYQPTFNPLDKLLEAYEENKKLYERLLESEREKVALLEGVLKGK